MNRPIIGIPAGDPAGIGPEIVFKALANEDIYDICRPVVVGCADVFKKIGKILESGLTLNIIKDPSEGLFQHGTLDIIECGTLDATSLKFGEVQAEAGKSAFECIKKVTELALEKKIHAVATTSINKEAIRAAKLNFIGHTEMLAELTGSYDPLTMFQVRNMRVFFLSRHVSLRQACDLVTKDRLCEYIQRCTEALTTLGVKDGLMAVAGLNPHNGEHGLFGDEEVTDVDLAVREMQAKGFNVCGPVPADSVFAQALAGRFAAVLSLYHDQGHIATKTVDFERTISLTIGLPFLRTSVDHGTAFDIAGKGIASGVSMKEAILLAAEYAPFYNNKRMEN